MRLPFATLRDTLSRLPYSTGRFVVLGCIAPEERCLSVPLALPTIATAPMRLIKIIDPPDAFPDYSAVARRKIERHKEALQGAGVNFEDLTEDLLASDDSLLAILDPFEKDDTISCVVLDITSLPKRYFCFFLKRLIRSPTCRNLIVTYTASGGYPLGHLAEDPMTCDHLPGFAVPVLDRGRALVVAIGFESLGVASIIEAYSDRRRDMRVLLSFPPDGMLLRRQWRTLRDIVGGDPARIDTHNLRVIATWDAEEVYYALENWAADTRSLTLAPFGAKPHTLGMALFAIRNDCALVYTQPKSYNPDYTVGYTEPWAYVAKWGSIPCFDRRVVVP